MSHWSKASESNRRNWVCNPAPSHSASLANIGASDRNRTGRGDVGNVADDHHHTRSIGVRGESRTPACRVRSAAARFRWRGLTLWSGRLESNQHEEVGSLPRSHYATPALVSRASPSREGTTRTFGDRGPSRTGWIRFWRPIRYHYLAANWGERRDSNPLRELHRLAANLFAFAHHPISCAVHEHTSRERRTWSRRRGSNSHRRATRAEVCH